MVSQLTADVRKTVERLHAEGMSIAFDQQADVPKPRTKQSPKSALKDLALVNARHSLLRLRRYQNWYSECMPLIRQLLPDRYDEFCEQYKLSKTPKELDVTTYTINDFLNNIAVSRGDKLVFDPKMIYYSRVSQQAAILQSGLQRLESLVSDLRTSLQAELLDDSISTARALQKSKHIRAAGAVAGVALEAHLQSVLRGRGIILNKKTPTIADLNDALKREGVIDVVAWRQIGRFADIRNYCVHSKEREPTSLEVCDLIDGTESVSKSLY